MGLRVLALGDSVVWCQGLRPEEKFATLFYDRITGRKWTEDTGDELRDLRAHSGAEIDVGPAARAAAPDVSDVSDKEARHEIPSPIPTVREQVEAIGVSDGADTDIVILDGGANDLGVSGRLFTLHVLSEDFAPQRDTVPEFEKIFLRRMGSLLDDALARFPDATLIVTGYYPILSRKSVLARMPAFLLLHWLTLNLASTGSGLLPAAGLKLAFEKAKRNALFFHRMQLRFLRRAVTEKAAHTGRRILFAHPRFREENAIAAWRTEEHRFVFEPDTPDDQPAWIRDLQRAIRKPDPRLVATLLANVEPQRANHEVAVNRRRACDVANEIDPEDPGTLAENMACRLAPIGHPTVEGSRAYGDALIRVWRDARRISIRRRFESLSPNEGDGFSLRRALDRYGLPRQEGTWLCSQLLDVDAIEITVETSPEKGAGTDDRVFLRIAEDREWLLNESLFELDFRDDFERARTDTFVIDPALDGETLHLGEVKELTLRTLPNLDPAGAWRPRRIMIRINGWPVFKSTIDQLVTPSAPWTAPDYPREERA